MTHVPWHPEESEVVDSEAPPGFDSVELLSVGIDIGTTTTHLLFSRLRAQRQGSSYSSEFKIVDREVTYQSPIRLTPYVDGTTIDADAIEEFLTRWYDQAGYSTDDVDTGAVIVTGEASRKENAEAISSLFSERAGKFVCAIAGPNLEALMSAHGSGAVDHALEEDVRVLHVDVGGGTTKLASIEDGFVRDTASINVGAHLVEFDDEGRIVRTAPAAERVASDLGIDLEPGAQLTARERRRIVERFTELLFELIDGELSTLGAELMVTEVPEFEPFDVVTFAGGVAEYIYGRDAGYDDDLGAELGEAIRSEANARGLDVGELGEGIRATALGSTNHSMQVSGNTVTITDDAVLPLQNVPMIPFVAERGTAHTHGDDHRHEHPSTTDHHHEHPEKVHDELTRDVLEKLDLYDVDELSGGFAFGFHLHGLPTYDFLSEIADAVIEGWETFDGEHPIVMAFDTDVAMNAGRIVSERVDVPVIAVDGVELSQFGYIDVGEELEDTGAVPLTVKSLVFKG